MNNNGLKLFFSIVFTVLFVLFALIPETIMYFTWHLVQPENPIQRLAMVALFFVGGGGLCVFFGILAVALWAAVIGAILD
jgi:hypothetical protein